MPDQPTGLLTAADLAEIRAAYERMPLFLTDSLGREHDLTDVSYSLHCLLASHDALTAACAAKDAMLGRLEYVEFPSDMGDLPTIACPICFSDKVYGEPVEHSPNCALAAALRVGRPVGEIIPTEPNPGA